MDAEVEYSGRPLPRAAGSHDTWTTAFALLASGTERAMNAPRATGGRRLGDAMVQTFTTRAGMAPRIGRRDRRRRGVALGHERSAAGQKREPAA